MKMRKLFAAMLAATLAVTTVSAMPMTVVAEGTATAAVTAGGSVAINKTNFPDEEFRSYISENFDTDGDGVLSAEEIAEVIYIDCLQAGVTRLDGIEYFTALEYLVCEGNALLSLDVSKNTALIYLSCGSNFLTSLDLSKNTKLSTVESSGNFLEVAAENGSYSLDNLTKYGFDSAKASDWVGATYNSTTNTLENIASYTVTYTYDLGNGETATFALDITNSNQESVAINETNFPDEKFRSYIAENFDTDGDGILSAKEISKVTRIVVDSRGIKSLKGVEYFTALTLLNCKFNNLTNLDVSKNTVLTYLNCSHNTLASLDITKNTALEYLYCNFNQLTSLDGSKNTALTDLMCGVNKLTSLDVSKNTALETLDCDSNELTSLDVSKNTALTKLTCSLNQLTSLDVSKNTALTSLSCGDNQLTSIDVSKNTALAYLECDNNQLTSIDVSKNTALAHLGCDGNQLTSLDVSKNTALTNLTCSLNQLTSLDVSKNTALTYLHCDGNQLTSLDISKNTALTELSCSDNQLTSLDVSKNTGLVYLWYKNNHLTSLDLSNNTAIFVLDHRDNQFAVTTNNNSYSLDNLTKYGFDPARASNWTGATYNSGTNSIENITAEKVTYTYDLGNGYVAAFTLVVTASDGGEPTTPDEDEPATPDEDEPATPDEDETETPDEDTSTTTIEVSKGEGDASACGTPAALPTVAEGEKIEITDFAEYTEEIYRVQEDDNQKFIAKLPYDETQANSKVQFTVALDGKTAVLTTTNCYQNVVINGETVSADEDYRFAIIVIEGAGDADIKCSSFEFVS